MLIDAPDRVQHVESVPPTAHLRIQTVHTSIIFGQDWYLDLVLERRTKAISWSGSRFATFAERCSSFEPPWTSGL